MRTLLLALFFSTTVAAQTQSVPVPPPKPPTAPTAPAQPIKPPEPSLESKLWVLEGLSAMVLGVPATVYVWTVGLAKNDVSGEYARFCEEKLKGKGPNCEGGIWLRIWGYVPRAEPAK